MMSAISACWLAWAVSALAVLCALAGVDAWLASGGLWRTGGGFLYANEHVVDHLQKWVDDEFAKLLKKEEETAV